MIPAKSKLFFLLCLPISFGNGTAHRYASPCVAYTWLRDQQTSSNRLDWFWSLTTTISAAKETLFFLHGAAHGQQSEALGRSVQLLIASIAYVCLRNFGSFLSRRFRDERSGIFFSGVPMVFDVRGLKSEVPICLTGRGRPPHRRTCFNWRCELGS